MIHDMAGGAGVKLPGIYVVYPAGSTCTCTNGTKTYTAKGTSGYWFFGGLAVGTWTVKATNGTDSASKSVSITSVTQAVSVELSYNYYLFKSGSGYQNGHTIKTLMGSTTVATDKSYILLDDSGSSASDRGYFSPVVNVENYSTLCIEYEKTSSSTNNILGFLSANTAPTGIEMNTAFAAKMSLTADLNTRTTQRLDISSVSDSKYLGWYIASTTYIYNLYLE